MMIHPFFSFINNLQSNLKLNEAQALLMQARGAFDPKLEADFNNKEFGDNLHQLNN